MGRLALSVRLARFTDHWRKALAREYPVRYERLRYSGLRSLHDDEIVFENGITAIVGGNGVGKSTLAHAAVDVLGGLDGVQALSVRSVRLSGGRLQASVLARGNRNQLELVVQGQGSRQRNGETSGRVIWLDPSDLGAACQKQILGDPEFDELLDSFGSRRLLQAELELASYVVGKDYESCEVWEISDYGGLEVLPYFRVTSNGISYGSEAMGSGELSLLICLWFLNGVERESVVVLEEPETHVSSRSQDALMNLVAWACATRGIWVIITTHSAVVLRRLPLKHVRLLVTDGGKSRLIANPTLHQVGTILGGGIAYRSMLLVEDECAKHFVNTVLERLHPDLRHQLTVVIATGGEARVATVLRQLPSTPEWSLVGAFDGDMRGRVDATGFEWPHVFLPGAVPPEQLLRVVATPGGATEKIAGLLYTTTAQVAVALNAAAGHDHHDWLTQMCRVLGPSIEGVVRVLTRLWIDENEGDAITLVRDIEVACAAAGRR